MGHKLVIFDLDGTLTPLRESTAPFEHRLLLGVQAKIADLHRQGVHMGIATNQGGLRKVPALIQDFSALVHWLQAELPIHEVRFATTPGPRKKPEPGMLFELMIHFGVEAHETLYVGDYKTDWQAAQNAGCDFAWNLDFFDPAYSCPACDWSGEHAPMAVSCGGYVAAFNRKYKIGQSYCPMCGEPLEQGE